MRGTELLSPEPMIYGLTQIKRPPPRILCGVRSVDLTSLRLIHNLLGDHNSSDGWMLTDFNMDDGQVVSLMWDTATCSREEAMHARTVALSQCRNIKYHHNTKKIIINLF